VWTEGEVGVGYNVSEDEQWPVVFDGDTGFVGSYSDRVGIFRRPGSSSWR
jgi:hypothetical protein